MIWAVVLLGVLFVVAAAVTAFVSPVKAAVGLLGTGVIVSVAFVALTITNSVATSGPMGASLTRSSKLTGS